MGAGLLGSTVDDGAGITAPGAGAGTGTVESVAAELSGFLTEHAVRASASVRNAGRITAASICGRLRHD